MASTKTGTQGNFVSYNNSCYTRGILGVKEGEEFIIFRKSKALLL